MPSPAPAEASHNSLTSPRRGAAIRFTRNHAASVGRSAVRSAGRYRHYAARGDRRLSPPRAAAAPPEACILQSWRAPTFAVGSLRLGAAGGFVPPFGACCQPRTAFVFDAHSTGPAPCSLDWTRRDHWRGRRERDGVRGLWGVVSRRAVGSPRGPAAPGMLVDGDSQMSRAMFELPEEVRGERSRG